jgi:hypothetical protein
MPNQPEKLMPDGSPIAVNSSGSTRSVPALHPRENLQTRTVRLNFGTPATYQALMLMLIPGRCVPEMGLRHFIFENDVALPREALFCEPEKHSLF